MHYKVRVFIGGEAENEGWLAHEVPEVVELRNSSEKILVKIIDEKVIIEINGEGRAVIVRENKSAKLKNKTEGVVKVGDVIWLLNKKAEEEYNNGERREFLGAAVLIEFNNLEPVKKQEIFINERSNFLEKNGKNFNLILGLVVFCLLIAGTLLGYQKRTESEQKKKYEEIKNGVEAKIIEIESVRTVNIETALELAKNAESMVSNAGTLEKKYTGELTTLRQKINEVKMGLGGENMDYEVAYDTTLILEGENQFKSMAVKENILYLWSPVTGQINMVDPTLKSTEKIVADERIKTWLGIFNNGEKWFGYSQNKIFEIKRNDLVENEIKGVTTVKEMTGWNGLTYVLDNGALNIVKLGGGEGKMWLKEGTSLGEEASSMSIDSSIWVLGKSGKIYQYIRGGEEKYVMSFLPTMTQASNLRTTDKVKFLAYITDENTVVIYGKDGKILGKYNFSKVKINDIGIENQNNAVLVLASNGKIYRIKIK